MSESTVTHRPVEPNQFETIHHIDARFAGGTITADIEHFDWIGENVVRVEIPGMYIHFRPHEARDLAAALQALATYIDEEPRELHRSTEPGEPAHHGVGGGL